MKRIMCVLLVLLSTVSFAFAESNAIDSYEASLLSFPAGKAVQDKIDPIIDGMSELQKDALHSKVQKYVKQYKNDPFYYSVFQYISAKTGEVEEEVAVEVIVEEDNSTGDIEECPSATRYDYQSGLTTIGWVIPNVCDTSLPDGIYRGEGFENGQIGMEIPILDGRYHGDAVWYYENGLIQAKGTYDYGTIVGDYYWYNERGALTQKNTYKDNNTVDVTLYYQGLKEAELVAQTYTTVNGKYHGTQILYYTNGNISSTHTFSNGLASSNLRNFYKNGDLKLEVEMDGTVLVDKDDLRVQNGDTVLYNYVVFDVTTGNAVFASEYAEEEIVGDDMILPDAKRYLIDLSAGDKVSYVMEKYFQEEESPLYNLDLKFTITVLEIERP